MNWKNFGETTTEEGHNVFFGGKEDKHEHGVGFLVRLRAVPFNITTVQAYALTSDYDDNEIE